MMRRVLNTGRTRVPRAQSGQALVIVTLAMTAIIGMLGLAVDVGHAYERRQYLQNLASSAALVGSYQTKAIITLAVSGSPYYSLSAAQKDAAVTAAMLKVIADTGTQVKNASGNTLSAPVSDPCAAGYSQNQVDLQAEYLDRYDNPVMNGSGPLLVGQGLYASNPAGQLISGVKVLEVGTCVPRFFAAVLGTSNFRETSSAQAGQPHAIILSTAIGTTATPTISATPTASVTPTGTTTPTPSISATPSITATPTVNSIQSFSIIPFYVYGLPGTSPTLFAQGSQDFGNGDIVTFYNGNGTANSTCDQNNTAWNCYQFANTSQGLSGQNGDPGGVTVHDSSLAGCLDPSTTAVQIGSSYFNAGGNGHCAELPAVGDIVSIPLVREVCKQGTCTDETQVSDCNSNGGYCVQVIGVITLRVTAVDTTGKMAAGMIIDVVYDPYHVVENYPATATVTSTVTNTPTITATSTATGTITPTPSITPA